MKRLILSGMLLWLVSMPTMASHPGGTVHAQVNGLVCDFCARAVEKVFKKQAAVDSINVDLDKKLIIIHFKGDQKLDDKTIRKLITDSGYDVRGITHGE